MQRYHAVVVLTALSLILVPAGHARQAQDGLEMHPAVEEMAIDSLIQKLINQTNLDTLMRTVKILSGEDSVSINGRNYLLLSRHVAHPHNDLAADFIHRTLSRYGLATFNQNYSATGRNVYAVRTGTNYPGKKFIIGAHYDGMPSRPPAPGADDNASGTAAVLEAARLLANIPAPYTIIFALWDEEEIGLLGSAYFAKQAFQAREDLLGVINLDMLGWDGNNDGRFEIHTRPVAQSVDLANRMKSLEDDYNLGLSSVIYSAGTGASDHASFWNQGYSAILLIESYSGGDFNPFYHSSNDRTARFDLDFFHGLSKLAVATIAHLAFYNFPVHLEEQEAAPVADFRLEQNYPNPFSASGIFENPGTTIAFTLSNASLVTLKIYDLLGNEVATLVSEKLPAGKHQRVWEPRGLASGEYLYRLRVGELVEAKKMLVIR